MAGFYTIDDLPALQNAAMGRRVILRADLNVPMGDGTVSDATRIERLAPTIAELAAKGFRVVVISHFGRPGGKRDATLSLAPITGALQAAIGSPVIFVAACIGTEAEAAVGGLGVGGVALMENLRFHPGEEANDPEFARALARLGDIYVNDAFSVAHRAHASTEALARLLPAAAGRLMQAELEALAAALETPKRPVLAVIGGAKVSTKLDLLANLVAKVDVLMVAGAMANTFLHALGTDVAASLCEPDMAPNVREVMARADGAGCEIALPSDVVVASAFEEGADCETVPIAAVPPGAMILDVGVETAAALVARLEDCRTLLWNGPLGAFETPPFDASTVTFARAAAARTTAGRLISVAGGGDTMAVLTRAGVIDDLTFVSTAGGAFLEWLEGKALPGVKALEASKGG
jgi:phosphoglycerate kinase